jgi:hypothetical protein
VTRGEALRNDVEKVYLYELLDSVPLLDRHRFSSPLGAHISPSFEGLPAALPDSCGQRKDSVF